MNNNLVCESAYYQGIFQHYFVCHIDRIATKRIDRSFQSAENPSRFSLKWQSRLNKFQPENFKNSF